MTDKGKILAFPDTAAIEAEAAAWVARFDAGEVSAKDQAAFQEWLNRTALHRQAIAEYGLLWSEFDGLRLLTMRETARGTRPAGLTRPWLAACAAAAVAAAGGMVFFHPKPHAPPQALATAPARFVAETPVGGHKRITLADGSSVMLNTDSRLDVDFSLHRRDVRLVRGEAYFEVVHDKARPFTVRAGTYVVRDIGTAFDVHLSKPGQVEVGVTRGSVEVTPGAHVSSAPKSLGIVTAGHGVVLGREAEHPQTVSGADMGRKLAWRQGELIYTGQPLGEVLADISRYSDIQIELADPSLASLPVGGAFKIDQIAAIFAALENNFGVRAQWIDSQHVRFIAGREAPPSRD